MYMIGGSPLSMVVFSCRQVRALKMQRWAVVDQLIMTSVSVTLTSYTMHEGEKIYFKT